MELKRDCGAQVEFAKAVSDRRTRKKAGLRSYRSLSLIASEWGASLLEMAIVAPLLIALLFGIVDFGFILNDTISVRQGAREGARQAVVSNVGTNSSCATTGFSGTEGSDTDRLFCMVKDRVGLGPTDVRVKLDFEGTTFTATKSLVVCVMYPIRSVTGLISPFLSGAFRTEVQMRIEQTTVTLEEASETALAGQNWNWCQAEVTS